MIERLDQDRGLAIAERRTRDGPDRVNRFGANLRIVIVDCLEQVIDQFRRSHTRLDRQRPQIESRRRARGISNFHDEPQPLLRRYVLVSERTIALWQSLRAGSDRLDR